MKRNMQILAVLASLCLSSGCISLSHQEHEFLTELEACGISKTDQAIRGPEVAGALAMIPGAGNFYLAANTWASWQWLVGAGNILFFPWSLVWTIPQVMVDANTINMRETVHYYRYNPHGRAHLTRVQKRMLNDPSSSCGKVMPIEAP